MSYDGRGDAYASVRGFDGARAAERAIARLARGRHPRRRQRRPHARQLPVASHETLARARALGACEAQLLRYKPAGRAASLDYLARRLTPTQARALGPTLRALARDARAGRRSSASASTARSSRSSRPTPSSRADPARLERFGVFGCEAGGALAALHVDGPRRAVQLRAGDRRSRATTSRAGTRDDPSSPRGAPGRDAPAEPCASCALRSVCKGGCKVVSSFVDGRARPGPGVPARPRASRTRRDPADA